MAPDLDNLTEDEQRKLAAALEAAINEGDVDWPEANDYRPEDNEDD